jgi:hypothetical protein
MKELKYNYHVVYTFDGRFGSCTTSITTPMDTSVNIEAVRKSISKDYCNGSNVILLNWIELSASKGDKK